MIYYTNDSRKVEFTPTGEPMGSGTQGSVYDFGANKCIKIYGDNVTKYRPEIFTLFKELSLDGYCKLYDLLYVDPNMQEVAGYIMQKYINEVDNILNMPTEYTLNSFNILYNSIKLLADNRIFARDTLPNNAILSRDNIVLIDFDTCDYSTLPSERILTVNTSNILYLFKRLFKDGLDKMGKNTNDDELSDYLDYLFAYSSEPIKTLQRRMAYSKTPMDVLPYKYRY